MSIALQLTSRAKLCKEGGVVRNCCAAACKGEAAIANYCIPCAILLLLLYTVLEIIIGDTGVNCLLYMILMVQCPYAN